MAEILSVYRFPTKQPKYDWGELLDGQVRRLTRGVDFQCEVNTFLSAAKRALQFTGRFNSLRYVKEGYETVVIQAVMGEPKSFDRKAKVAR